MPTALLVTARTSSGFTLTFTGSGGETTWELELNPAADFISDDSLRLAGITASPITVTGLPNGVPFNMRLRATNVASAWSNTVFAATSEVTVDTSYGGFSVDKAMVVVPVQIFNISPFAGTGTPVTGFPGSNLLRDDPQSTFRASKGSFGIDFETSGEPVDTFALLGSLAAQGVTWQILGYTSAANRSAGTSVIANSNVITYRVSPTIARRRFYHGLHQFGSLSAATTTFWRILFDATALGPQFIARNLVVGKALTSVNASRGSGSSPQDFGSVQRNRFGTPDRIAGWRGRSVDFELSWLNEAEYHAKYAALEQLVGTTQPVLAIANSKRNVFLNDRIAFGNLTGSRAEVVRSGKHTKSFEVASLY